MKIIFFLSLFFLIFFPFAYAQEMSRPLYSLTIKKSINDENLIVDKFVGIDSSGNIYKGRQKTGKSVNIKSFSEEISKYVVEEKLGRYPGNNEIIVIEFPAPKLNEQKIFISVKFLDDFYKEENLRNKTYYSWGKPFSKNINDYPLFKYLSEEEINIIKSLLE